MIYIKDNVFHLNTKNTSYIFRVTRHGDLEHLYYGEKMKVCEDYGALTEKRSLLLVSTLYPEDDVAYGIDSMSFEYSFADSGDMRSSACRAYCENTPCRFRYDSYSTESVKKASCIPSAHSADSELHIYLNDNITGAKLCLSYRIFYESDCIVRSSRIEAGSASVQLHSFASLQVDFNRREFKAVTFNGAWARERFKQEQPLICGKFSIDAVGGASGARHNPFMMLAHECADNFSGEAYAFNLIYSGNHRETAECSPYGGTRFLSGISSDGFFTELAAGESFTAPEAVMTYSPCGYNGISVNMHSFIQKHIIPPQWRDKPKPILVNSWEAMYFNITEEKILALADRACRIGAELLVVDDGWFGKRNDDTSSLGDWWVNREKFPDGLRCISDRIHKKGLQFGLWFEPEMISRNSDLFSAHPDWALGNLERMPVILGRNQFVLDLTRRDVQDYIINIVSQRIEEIGIDYIKWDFNRLLSDIQSSVTPCGIVFHRYIMGLYRVLDNLVSRYPGVLFELCASGGARFDLGMLCYMPIGWVSDNTDVLMRSFIQEGTSYGYPPSVMCNHISVCPNHQTKRISQLSDRYSTASAGVMGFQYDLTACNEAELEQLQKYASEYKQIRGILNNATFYRLTDGFKGNYSSWLLVGENRDVAFLYVMQKLFFPVSSLPRLRLTGLNAHEDYKISDLDIRASGDVLMKSGVALPQNFQGNETHSEMSEFRDFTANIYKIERV